MRTLRLPTLVLWLAALITVAGSQDPSRAQPRKLNVLFIAVDDLNARLGCYGAPVKSPNIDALARRGVRFERAYCQYPLCNPSRSSLMTGRRPTTTGITENTTWFRQAMPDVVTLPQHFRANGYYTAKAGKMFHGGLEDDKGWVEGSEGYAPRAPMTPEQRAQRQRNSDRWSAVEGDGEGQPDYRTATRAIELLGKHREEPFFLGVGFVKPHTPFVAPKKYFDLYDPAKIQLPPDFAPNPQAKDSSVPAPALRPNFDIFIRRDASEEQAREAIAAYYAATSFMDAQVGRVLDALDRLKLRDSTIVVLFGDHGFHLGDKGMWSKQSLFEMAARVPVIVAMPGSGPSRPSPRTVELVDLYPTLAEACGLPMLAGLQGESLVPLLKKPDAAWDHPAYTMQKRGQVTGHSVRTERYRYTEWNDGNAGTELYDHQSDPDELRNLAADPAHARTVAEMKQLLRKGRTEPYTKSGGC
jgi:iduronate 2-sulfatase